MYSFYAFLFRMKYINRWGLMKSIEPENVAEHCQHTALVAHALAVIDNKVFGKNVDANRVGMLALYHETGEVLTGDLPTPIKYFSDEIRLAYGGVEAEAEKKLLGLLPEDIKSEISALVQCDKNGYEYKLVKCADKLAAYIKCIEELRSLNNEFKSAHDSSRDALLKLAEGFPSVKYFMDNFIEAYYKNLDELTPL